jgi:hypothetical protein
MVFGMASGMNTNSTWHGLHQDVKGASALHECWAINLYSVFLWLATVHDLQWFVKV